MKPDIDPRIFDLYDTYCHSGMDRRDFLQRAGSMGIVGGLAMATSLLPDYALASQVSFNDERIHAEYVRFESPGGNAEDMRAYVVRPSAEGPAPAVLVVHENRGRNPYIEDVARRLAIAGFLAVAPDALWAVGGWPGNDDDGKALQSGLDRDKILIDMLNSARFARSHARGNGRLGVTGFCFGGFVTNHLAAELGAQVDAAVPFYGRPPALDAVGKIKARLLLHYADSDDGVNSTRAAYEAALKEHGARFESHVYPGTQHGFHNDSTPRYAADAAELAWKRTLAVFDETLRTA